MSEIKVNSIKGVGASAAAITVNNSDGTCTANITNRSNRNIIINGAMQVAQRGTSFTATGNEYTVDRFSHHTGSGFNFDTTTTQSSDAPDNFAKAIKITPDSVVTPSATQNGLFAYSIEGQDVQQLAYGTSSPQKITLSFYAKSASQNNNHQYTIQIRKVDTAGNIKHVLQPFTVTSSYQRFTFTFDGDTASDIVDGTGLGVELDFILVAGSSDLESATSTWATSSGFRGVTGQSNFMDNTSNEFYLTGVQLEVGSVATDFEHRSFGQELALCQRYYYQIAPAVAESLIGTTVNPDASADLCTIRFPVEMRNEPTLVVSNFSNAFRLYASAGTRNPSTFILNTGVGSTKSVQISVSGGTSGAVGFLRVYNPDSGVYATVAVTAEL